jgi:parallel beta-helix repeat protein
MKRRIVVASALLLAIPGVGHAATLNVPAQYSTIQSAVNAAAPGDTISVSAGTYEERVRIKSLDNLTLVGDGLVDINPGNNNSAVVVRSSDGVTVQGLTVSAGKYAIRVVDCTNAAVLENTAEGTKHGIRVRNGSNNSVMDNGLTDLTGTTDEQGQVSGGHGIRIRNSANADVRRNTVTSTIDNPVGNGILASRADGIIVRNNNVTGVGRNGIRLGSAPGATVRGNDMTDTGASGILAKNAAGSTILGNNVTTASRNGIRIKRSAASTIDGNTCTGSGWSGVYVNRSNDAVVDGNTTNDNRGDGIALYRAENPTVTGNSASTNRRFGIRVRKSDPLETVSDLIGAGNTAVNNAKADYRVGDEVQ